MYDETEEYAHKLGAKNIKNTKHFLLFQLIHTIIKS
jgi:hypothetical protein